MTTFETRRIGTLNISVARNSASSIICYILMPLPLSQADLSSWSERYGVSLAAINGMDWDNDLTPWPAPNVPATEPPFKGLAGDMLHTLVGQVIPAVEGTEHYVRTLAGVSLSGLFTVWAWMQPEGADAFTSIGSISGSFWYPDFTPWLEQHVIPHRGRAYFSLGTKEGGPHEPKAFQDVRQMTAEVINIFNSHRITTHFQSTPGNHFAPIEPRIEKMLKWLYNND